MDGLAASESKKRYERWEAIAQNVPLTHLMASNAAGTHRYAIGDHVEFFVPADDDFKRGEIVERRAYERGAKTWIYDVKVKHGREGTMIYRDIPEADLYRRRTEYQDEEDVLLFHESAGIWIDGVIVPPTEGGGTLACSKKDRYTVRYNAQDVTSVRRFMKNQRVERGFRRLD